LIPVLPISRCAAVRGRDIMGIRNATSWAYKLQSFNELSSHAWFQMAGCAAFSVHGKQS
jgi:hypothetical protein